MKNIKSSMTENLKNDGILEIIDAIKSLNSKDEVVKLFEELFTENELKDFNNRWLLIKDLYNGETQRDISKNLGISLCKITRGSKLLKNKNSMVNKILKGN